MTKRTLVSLSLCTIAACGLVACGDDSTDSGADNAAAASSAVQEISSAAEEASATTEATSESAAETSEEPTSAAFETPAEVITTDSSPEFAAILASPDNCSAAVSDFAAANAGKTIQFDGYIANIVPSDAGQRYLVNTGAFNPTETPVGPSFEYGVGSPEELNLVSGDPSAIEIGHQGTFTATVNSFNQGSCLLSVDPVSTVLN